MNRLLLCFYILLQCSFMTAQVLDPSFGNNGVVISDSDGGDEEVEAVVLQPDGKILVMGDSFIGGDGDFYVMRFETNGAVDVDFGGDGLVNQLFSDVLNDSAEDAVILDDGKILVLGRMIHQGALAPVLVRLNSDGSLDTSFQGVGYDNYPIVATVDTYMQTLHLLPDGKVLIAGRIDDFGFADIFLFQLTADGQLDMSFGDQGWTYLDVLGSFDTIEGSIVLSDGSMIGAGWSFDPDVGSDRLLVVKYTPEGSLDDSFGNNGVLIGENSGGADAYRTITAYGSEYFLVAGYIDPDGDRDIIVSRYDFYGNPDPTFGDLGHVVLDNVGDDDQAVGIVELSDGSIVVGARTKTGGGQNNDFALIRLDSAGNLDESFGESGWFIHDETSGDIADRMVLQPDGKVILAGSVQEGEGEDIMMIRVMGIDPTSIVETNPAAAFQLSPNPARSVLRVSGNEPINQASIMSVKGRLVKEIAADNLPFEIDVSDLSSGQYFLQVDGISEPFVKVD